MMAIPLLLSSKRKSYGMPEGLSLVPVGDRNVRQQEVASRPRSSRLTLQISIGMQLLLAAARRHRTLEVAKRAPVRQVLDQPSGNAALGHHGGERMLLVVALGAAHLAELLLRHPDQAVGGDVQRAVDIRRGLLDLDGPRTRHAEGQVALLRLAAVAVVDADLDAQLGRFVVVEAAQRLEHVLLRVSPQALADPHLLALHDELHARKLRMVTGRRSALTLSVPRVR